MGNPSRRVPPALHCIHRSRGVAVQGSQPRHGVLRADACRRPARSGLPLPLPLARRTRTRRRAVDFARDGRPAEQFSRKMCGFACGIAISHTHTHTHTRPGPTRSENDGRLAGRARRAGCRLHAHVAAPSSSSLGLRLRLRLGGL
jgi:hypothetical protein